MNQACYRKLQNYKYQLLGPYVHDVGITGHPVDTPFLKLTDQGILEVKKDYAWDGPSGPTIDTLNFMRGSLVHDALYQLIRLEHIPPTYREHADRLLREICREDGMSRVRAWYVYQSVRRFGGSHAKPGGEKPDIVTCVPVEA